MEWDTTDPLAMVEGESTRANQALHDYAALGPGRSHTRLVETYQTATEPSPPTTRLATIKGWSVAYAWQDRVAAYDEAERRREREAVAAVRAQRAAELAERNWIMGQRLNERAIAMLDFPLATVEQVVKTRKGPTGTTEIHMNVVKPARWTMQSAAAMAEVAAKLGAMAAGEPTDRTAHVLDGLTKKDLEGMPLEELLLLRAKVGG